MPWSDIIGHREPILRLRTSAARGRLGQAYVFAGPAGIGKKQTAIRLSQALLCERSDDTDLDACGDCPACQQVAVRSHPDLLIIELPENKAEHPVASFIGDKETRGKGGLCFELSRHPFMGRRKIAIIDEAECLNEEGSNALLKTLEEPPPGSVLILVAASIDLLLPTIRSRCQVVSFQPLSPAEVKTVLSRESPAELPADIDAVVALAEGSLLTASQLLDPELRQQRKTLYEQLADPRYDSIKLADYAKSVMEGASTVKAGQRSHAGWMLRFCIEFFRQSLLGVAGGDAAGGLFPEVARFISRFPERTETQIDRLAELLDRCLQADRQIEANASLALALEVLFDDLGKILRSPLS